ncbi:linear amide C-N hydrolase [Agromyces atrinae]|uniref:linear amide C-N hydrolase n=1 Tax=Agromyces atrinae TaxID=592376 RepID=UPI001F579C02|nr:linear amide C-N hydrolase [Agromyces atrinae]MCI2959105.1 linear amide C-N hydrolase [Agromyces atrinae]
MCTSFQLRADDGSVCVGRTMEFPDMLGAKLTVIPRGLTLTSTAPSGAGVSWTTRYGVVGMDAIGQAQLLTDGMNEAGLYAGALYMPGFASYEQPGDDAGSTLDVLDAVAYALTTSATVAEVFAAFSEITVWGAENPLIDGIPPLHLVLHDATGAAGVIEFKDGAQKHRENPLGVATNAPYLDWHYDNVRNWLPRLTAANPGAVTVRGVEFAPLSQGQGFVGLPGDSGSAGRFLRAAAYVMTLEQPADAKELEHLTLHALNNFDIPVGMMTGVAATGVEQDDQTKWVSIASLSARRYIVRIQSNPTPVVVDLASLDLTGDAPRQLDLLPGEFTPITL